MQVFLVCLGDEGLQVVERDMARRGLMQSGRKTGKREPMYKSLRQAHGVWEQVSCQPRPQFRKRRLT